MLPLQWRRVEPMCDISLNAWLSLMERLELGHNEGTFKKLRMAYAEQHRHYHTAAHIKATLKHLKEAQHVAQRPDEMALALWFHDAIYKPFSKTNEQHSANWCVSFLADNAAHADVITRVHDLIMATCHQAATTPLHRDQALMVDVDLSILGAHSDLYAQYESWIRAEYRWVPGFMFRKQRKTLLTQLLAQSRLYHTEYFQLRYEAQARKNLTWAVKRLQ